MRVLIVGGSGRTGKLIIEEALKRGHTVTALVRDQTSIQDQKGLTLVRGSPLNKADIEAAVVATSSEKPAAVVVALNSTRATDNPWSAVTAPERLMADSHANLVAVMKQHGTPKIVTMSAFGTTDSFPSLNFLMRLAIKKSNLLYTFHDHDLVDQEMKESGVDFVLVRPAMLTDKEAQPVKHHGNDGKGVGFMPSISRKSVAVFLIDAVERNDWDGSTPVISN